jgi:DnaK suppressor protein
MAAKKTTSKPAPSKGKAKPAVKPSKPASAAKKPVGKTVAKAPAKKAAPVKKSAPLNKAIAAKPEKEAKLPVKPKPEAKASKPAAPAKNAPTKSRSSLGDFPVPPAAPVKPPFVPPAKVVIPEESSAATGANGVHHSPAFVQKQRQRLLDLRDELVDAMSGMTRDTIRNAPEGSEASGSGQHQGDAGSDAYDRDFALSVLAKEQDALYEIEQALRRIQAGSYGVCEMSSRKIPTARLEAIPFARLTVECQAQWEKEYGKRRFRPSNEVGFSGGNYIEDEDSETVSLDDDED